jgi:hypothetical protein
VNQPPLLPSDSYIASLLGLSADEYRWFKHEVYKRAKIQPGTPVAGLETLVIISLVFTVISIGLTIAASFFKPKARQQGTVTTSTSDPDNITRNQKFAPRYGFDSVQQPAVLGSTIPIVYAKRSDLPQQLFDPTSVWTGTARSITISGEYTITRIENDCNTGNSLTVTTGPLTQAPTTTTDVVRVQRVYAPVSSRCGVSETLTATIKYILTKANGSKVTVAEVSQSSGFPSFQSGSIRITGSIAIIDTATNQVLKQDVITGEATQSAGPPRPSGTYGGVRVNLQLIWSQLLSVGGDQFLRSIFLLGEANTASIESLAIGDNPIGGYDLLDDDLMNAASRLTVYYRPMGGRIQNEDYVLGLDPSKDRGNAINVGGLDVYEVISANNPDETDKKRPSFCYTYKPTTSTVFGLSNWLPNDQGYRVNPTIGPTGQIDKESKDDGRKFKVNWIDDYTSLANLWKFRYVYNRRCAFSGFTKTYEPGETFLFRLYSSSDAETVFIFNKSNAREPDAEPPDGRAKCTDIASTIAAKQSAIDQGLVIGDLYKVGSCLAVVVDRSPEDKPFVSEADNAPTGNGTTVTYTFKVVRGGYVEAPGDNNPSWSGTEIRPPYWDYNGGQRLTDVPIPNSADKLTVSRITQGFKCDIGDITLPRAARVFEVGIKSTVGIRVTGLCNFKDASSYQVANDSAGGKFIDKTYDAEKTIGVQQYNSGTITTNEERYSFFKIYCRPNSESPFEEIGISFAVKSKSSQPVYNYLRFEFQSSACWQLRFEPITSWELRKNTTQAPYIVLDHRYKDESVEFEEEQGGLWVAYTGYKISNSFNTFRLTSLEPRTNLGLGYTDKDFNVMTDPWGKVAEAFSYDEIQTSVSDGPEHEIAYVNIITDNETKPLYDNLSILGLNIRAAQQWTRLSQVSVYVSGGRTIRRLLDDDTVGPSNLFPDIMRDLLLSPRFGMGETITESQIDIESFQRAAQWCFSRRYFFDGVISEKVNLRQWAADTGAGMLLEFLQRDGKFALEPALIFPTETAAGLPYGPVPISGIFTVGNIVENSFSMEFLSEEDRQPVQVSVKWREERLRQNYSSSGLFPVEREVLVRETSTPDTVPIESFDVSEYCTNLEHAIDFACYIIRVRRLITHSVKFSTTPEGIDNGIRAGDYIKVALDFTFYDEFANGVILEDGTIVSTRPDLLLPGTHAAVYWDGSDSNVVEGTITIDSNGLATPTGVVFIKKNINSEVRVYKVESISLGENGVIDIEAVHHPVDSSGVSLLGKNWTTYATDANWVIKTN